MRQSFVLLAAICIVQSAHAQPDACANAAKVSLPDTTFTAAGIVDAGKAVVLPEIDAALKQRAQMTGMPVQAPPTPTFCRVQGVIRSASTSEIKFEVWLPIADWNERYWGVGNGGFAGYIAY